VLTKNSCRFGTKNTPLRTSSLLFNPPPVVSYEAAETSEKELTLVKVADWVEKWGRRIGRLRFFVDLNPTCYFELVAKSLLSIKSTGSISVERAAKPMKTRVATKGRSRLSTDKRTILLRVGLNLRLKNEKSSFCKGCSWKTYR
jgi:hypothetical protein